MVRLKDYPSTAISDVNPGRAQARVVDWLEHFSDKEIKVVQFHPWVRKVAQPVPLIGKHP